uniref:Uncharacterized protein n=1 Tax=Spongospora subterranea TaxID=70186 RepID=A0A0H5QP73_9EUKA|eukprot:CRZ03180.1 hypothetical protein [Spongospora subterranea]
MSVPNSSPSFHRFMSLLERLEPRISAVQRAIAATSLRLEMKALRAELHQIPNDAQTMLLYNSVISPSIVRMSVITATAKVVCSNPVVYYRYSIITEIILLSCKVSMTNIAVWRLIGNLLFVAFGSILKVEIPNSHMRSGTHAREMPRADVLR